MMIEAEARGWGETAGEVAVLLSERGLGGNEPDLELRLRRWRGERGKRAEAARGLAKRWLQLVRRSGARQGAAGRAPPAGAGTGEVGGCVALAFPDRLSKRRDASGENWISAGGRGFRLDPLSPLARETWLAVAEVGGTAAGARVLAAAPIEEATVESLFADRIESGTKVSFDPASGSVSARRGRRLGAITLSEGRDGEASADAVAAALLDGVAPMAFGFFHGATGPFRFAAVPPSQGCSIRRSRTLATRRSSPRWTNGSLPCCQASAGSPTWIPPRSPAPWTACWDGRAARPSTGWPRPRSRRPAGSSHAIDYEAEAGPTVTARVQALFGLSSHPSVADGRVPLVLSLTSPAGRPIQTTRDLPGFWSGSWAAVAKEMRGRYPRHPWPDDPARADPTLRTKKAVTRSRSPQ
jgi:ATP-dependent helicase HrpB